MMSKHDIYYELTKKDPTRNFSNNLDIFYLILDHMSS
jgi:hypothetical protein